MDTAMVPPEPGDSLQADLDRILAELATGFHKLPISAIHDARKHRDAIVPRLIEVIEKATARARSGEKVEGNAHFFALFLLAEFQAKESLPAILEAMALPGNLSSDLYGDVIHETLPRTLVVLTGDHPEVIDAVIRNPNLYQYVRWSAANCYTFLLRDQRMTRDEVVARLRKLLREAIENRDEEVCAGIVLALDAVGPQEALEEINEAYDLGVLDAEIIDIGNIEQSIAAGEAGVRKMLGYLPPTEIADTIHELSGWASFQERPPASEPPIRRPLSVPQASPPNAPLPPGPPAVPVESSKDRVGRNEPCPCGSGKKFKKCCGGG